MLNPSSRRGTIIINADDFGYSDEVNEAVAQAFGEGLITSATIMANGDAFSQACDLAVRKGFANAIGIHLNFTEGVPLTDKMRMVNTLCDRQGRFCFKRGSRMLLRPRETDAVRGEVAAQIDRCRKAGLALTHADSHHHCHTELPILLPIIPVLRSHRIPFLRLSDNIRPASIARRSYKRMFNALLSVAGLRGTDYFCDLRGLEPVRDRLSQRGAIVEVMVHSGYGRGGVLVDTGTGVPLAEAKQSIAGACAFRSYRDLFDVKGKG